MPKVLITTVPFGDVDRYPLNILEKENISYLINPLGKKLTEDELINLVGDSEIIIAGTEPITAKVISKAKNLKMISRVGIGLDSVDLIAAKKRNIKVSYTPDAPAPAVADLTMGLMYSLLRRVHEANVQLHQAKWNRLFGRRLTECTVGIVGVGRIGSNVLRNLKALGCKRILYYDKNVRLDEEDNEQIMYAEKTDIYKVSDIVSFHLPLDLETNDMFTINEMKTMKKNAFVINTARGGIINEIDLSYALKENMIAGAAIDVFEDEPYFGDLIEYDNCILTSHMGSMSIDCRTQMEREATEEAVRFMVSNIQDSPVPIEEYLIQSERLK
jgi:D-3-phosphoglycerate dehydrogenase / 2-oxoglutarate reductase